MKCSVVVMCGLCGALAVAGARSAIAGPTSGGAKSPIGLKPLQVMPVAEADFPPGVKMTGASFESAVMFADKNGTNYVIFSSKHVEGPPSAGPGPGPGVSNYVYVDEWVVAPGKKPRNLLPVRDFVYECVMGDPEVKFHPDAFDVTDLDHDGVAEVTFAYQLGGCRSDVRPAGYKLLTLENGNKFIFRGYTKIHGYDDAHSGGDFTPEPDESGWPAGTFAHAQDLWTKTMRDLEEHWDN